MKRGTSLFLAAALTVVGCASRPSLLQQGGKANGSDDATKGVMTLRDYPVVFRGSLPSRPDRFDAAEWIDQFDQFFLSKRTVKYGKSAALLRTLGSAALASMLSQQDRELIRGRLTKYLSHTNRRLQDPTDRVSFGLAPAESWLRIAAVGLLGELGGTSDIAFLCRLRSAEDSGGCAEPFHYIGRNGLREYCDHAIRRIEARTR